MPSRPTILAALDAAYRQKAAAPPRSRPARSSGEYGRQVRRRIERGLLLPATRYVDALRLRRPLLQDLMARFLPPGAHALVLPTMSEPAPAIEEANGPDENERRFASSSYWSRAVNYLGCPAISTPMGFVEDLPVGLQLVGRPFGQAAILRIAALYAAETGWPLTAMRRPS